MKIDILVLDGVFDTGLTALLDTFATANELMARSGDAKTPFEVRLAGLHSPVCTAMGLTTLVEDPACGHRPDWVIVPAINTKQPERLLEALNRRDVIDAKARLRDWHAAGIPIASACLGTFILADAGLLDGHRATTSWPLATLFRQRYPKVELDDSHMVIACDNLVTAGAAMGHLDLALWLVRQASPDLAARVARFLLIDTRASQGQYIIPDHLAHADALIQRFERWARRRLALGFSLKEAAQALHVHPRTLQRRTEAVLGKSPLAFFQDLRVERARQRVANGGDLEAIAGEVGYADASTLRNLLRRKLGRGVRELRNEIR
ncbi:GlxA family transcriptional regulator [Pseudomonas sp. RHF3.3-3]|uniref:GlxA family transcriptional regulator n=1 Tax=Pseudomonas sp. RHF3.3-3 TaxID=3396624 RepID=UPI003A8AA483